MATKLEKLQAKKDGFIQTAQQIVDVVNNAQQQVEAGKNEIQKLQGKIELLDEQIQEATEEEAKRKKK